MFYLKKLFRLIALVIILSQNTSAADNLQIYKKAKEIKILSQSIAKNYLYINQKLQVSSARIALKKNILALNNDIKYLQKNIVDQESKELVEFMFFSTDELEEILKEKFNPEIGGLAQDYTESLLEGSDIISKQFSKHNLSGHRKMLETVVEMQYLLERAAKYYIAFRAGYTDSVNIEQANIAINNFGKLLGNLKTFEYPVGISSEALSKLLKYWPASKNFYLGIRKSKLPSIVFISTKHMAAALSKLANFHKNSITK